MRNPFWLIGLASLFTGSVFAQAPENPSVTRYMASAGVSIGSAGIGSSIVASVNRLDAFTVSIRASMQEELKVLTIPLETVWEIGGLYCVACDIDETRHKTLSVGIGLVGGVLRGAFVREEVVDAGWFTYARRHYERKPFVAVGLIADVQIFYIPLKYAGLGFHLFGNLNQATSFAGIAFHFVLRKR